MEIRLDSLRIPIGEDSVGATLLEPAHELPGVLFVHGWGGSQLHDLALAKRISGLGCVCLTFDLRGHGDDSERSESVTRIQNLNDLVATYDWLANRENVDATAMAVVGISYGGYLSALLSAMRPIRWLALRSPALYKDEEWEQPKRALHLDADLPFYRRRQLSADENRALGACGVFSGDVLLLEADDDDIVPHTVTENYANALRKTRSTTMRTIENANHAFSGKPAQRAYADTLTSWLTEMITGARATAAAKKVESHKAETATSKTSG
jgi:pimeloyl-ACP methyl ester carboxylesterase